MKNLPVLLVLLCASPSVGAQDINDFDKEFEAFQKEANSKYEDFRDECNAQYAKFLAESWKSFKALAPVERPKEQQNLPESVLKMMQNPAQADIVRSEGTDAGVNFKGFVVDIKKFIRKRMVEPMVKRRGEKRDFSTEPTAERKDKNKKKDKSEESLSLSSQLSSKEKNTPREDRLVAQVETPVRREVQPVKQEEKPVVKEEKPVVRQDEPSKRMKTFNFYGTPMTVEVGDLERKLKLNGIEPQKVADAWTLCSKKQYTSLMEDCLDLKDKYKLCDWAYLEMIKTLADGMYGEGSNESIFLTAYIYCQSGYRIRLGQSNNQLLMLYGSEHTIYNKPRFMMDGLCFYVLGENKSNSMYWIEACDKAINDKEQSLSLMIPEQPNLTAVESEKRVVESDKYPEMRMEVSVNENLIEFFNNYPSSCLNSNPLTRWAMYANTPLAADVQAQIYPTLRTALEGLSEEEKVSRLLSLIQPRSYNKPETSLVYGMDDQMWGHDRAFFAEETLFYPYSDCEDHAILFSRLVRDLVGLQVALVYYSAPYSPPHLATAVRFSEPLKGENQDRLKMPNGDTFYICDPTNYIPQPGVTMREMNNSKAQVMLLDI